MVDLSLRRAHAHQPELVPVAIRGFDPGPMKAMSDTSHRLQPLWSPFLNISTAASFISSWFCCKAPH